MSDDHLLRRTEAHFELLARETVRLGLNTNETRTAFFQQQREFLLTSLSGAGLSEHQLAAEINAFDAAVNKLEKFVNTVAADQPGEEDPRPTEPPPQPPKPGPMAAPPSPPSPPPPPQPGPVAAPPSPPSPPPPPQPQEQIEDAPAPPPVPAKPFGKRPAMKSAAAAALTLATGILAIVVFPGLVYPAFDAVRNKLPAQMRHVCDTRDGVKDLAQLQSACTQRIESWLVFKQDLSRAYRNRAWAYWKQKKNGLARSDFTKAIETNSQDAEAYWLRGVFISGSMTRKSTTADIKLIAAKGIADFTRAIEADPNHLNAYMSRGRTHSFLKDYDKSIADYSRAIEINPKHINAYFRRASTHRFMRDYDKAITDYSRVIKVDPKNVQALVGRGETYSELKNAKKSLSDFERARFIAPTSVSVFYGRARAYLRLKKEENAKKDLRHISTLQAINPAEKKIQRSAKQTLNNIEARERVKIKARESAKKIFKELEEKEEKKKREKAAEVAQFQKCIPAYNHNRELRDRALKQKEVLRKIVKKRDQLSDELKDRKRKMKSLEKRGSLSQRAVDKFNNAVSAQDDWIEKAKRAHKKEGRLIADYNNDLARYKKSCRRSYSQGVKKTACAGNTSGYCAKSKKKK